MSEHEMKIELLDPNELKPYDKNPRLNDEAVEAVATSIREFGFRSPIIVDNDRVIIAGHTRYKAALRLGLKEVPVLVADILLTLLVSNIQLLEHIKKNVSNKVKNTSQLHLVVELDVLYILITWLLVLLLMV